MYESTTPNSEDCADVFETMQEQSELTVLGIARWES